MSSTLSSSTLSVVSSATGSPVMGAQYAKKLAWETALYLMVTAGKTYSHSAQSCTLLIFIPSTNSRRCHHRRHHCLRRTRRLDYIPL
jgi:hypothetical protein